MPLLNFRDVADALPNGPLRRGRLFRSAQPYRLDQADLALIRMSGIAAAIDLREAHEQVPPDWAPAEAAGLAVARIPLADQILPSADEQGPQLEPEVESDSVPEGHRILGAFYRAVVDQAGQRMGEVVSTVAQGEPVLIHCAAGKDRTGTTVALLLALIGTDSEDIIADYLATNDSLDDVLSQLTGQTAAERNARTDIPPGISDAPESAIRGLLDHVQDQGGARAVLLRNSDEATLDRVVAALTG